MKLKLKNGGIIKLQNAATTIPEIQNSLMDGIGLLVNKMWIPENLPVQRKTFWEKLSDWFKERKGYLKSTERSKVIGPWESAYGKPTRIVEHGGNMS